MPTNVLLSPSTSLNGTYAGPQTRSFLKDAKRYFGRNILENLSFA